MKRRSVFALIVAPLGAATGAVSAWAAAPAGKRAGAPLPNAPLPQPRSLAVDLSTALEMRKPLVVMVSLEGCPYCKQVRENYLVPMRHDQALPVVQVDMRSTRPVSDFAGAPRTHDQMVRAWGVKSAPTLLFFGLGGQEVAPRLTGFSADFYSAYLEQRLHQAEAAVKGR